jgi:hypothetical protein
VHPDADAKPPDDAILVRLLSTGVLAAVAMVALDKR